MLMLYAGLFINGSVVIRTTLMWRYKVFIFV